MHNEINIKQVKDKTHGGNWSTWRDCHSGDLILVAEGLQCCNCGAYTEDGKTWKPAPRTNKEYEAIRKQKALDKFNG